MASHMDHNCAVYFSDCSNDSDVQLVGQHIGNRGKLVSFIPASVGAKRFAARRARRLTIGDGGGAVYKKSKVVLGELETEKGLYSNSIENEIKKINEELKELRLLKEKTQADINEKKIKIHTLNDDKPANKDAQIEKIRSAIQQMFIHTQEYDTDIKRKVYRKGYLQKRLKRLKEKEEKGKDEFLKGEAEKQARRKIIHEELKAQEADPNYQDRLDQAIESFEDIKDQSYFSDALRKIYSSDDFSNILAMIKTNKKHIFLTLLPDKEEIIGTMRWIQLKELIKKRREDARKDKKKQRKEERDDDDEEKESGGDDDNDDD